MTTELTDVDNSDADTVEVPVVSPETPATPEVVPAGDPPAATAAPAAPEPATPPAAKPARKGGFK